LTRPARGRGFIPCLFCPRVVVSKTNAGLQ
jgi:hypothetical protein